VRGDELRLIQIMTNFISNANKYTPNGGTVTIRADVVNNQWDDGGAAQVMYCAITDTGIGMDETDLAQLFTAYWRSENPRAREQPGTGLGMTLTRGLVEAHGGKLWVESTPNIGTTFHFTIPLASSVEPEAST
jgi:signal transduction histidine kinase